MAPEATNSSNAVILESTSPALARAARKASLASAVFFCIERAAPSAANPSMRLSSIIVSENASFSASTAFPAASAAIALSRRASYLSSATLVRAMSAPGAAATGASDAHARQSTARARERRNCIGCSGNVVCVTGIAMCRC